MKSYTFCVSWCTCCQHSPSASTTAFLAVVASPASSAVHDPSNSTSRTYALVSELVLRASTISALEVASSPAVSSQVPVPSRRQREAPVHGELKPVPSFSSPSIR